MTPPEAKYEVGKIVWPITKRPREKWEVANKEVIITKKHWSFAMGKWYYETHAYLHGLVREWGCAEYPEHMIFPTEAEAQAECDERGHV